MKALYLDLTDPMREIRDGLVNLSKTLDAIRCTAAQLRSVEHMSAISAAFNAATPGETIQELKTSPIQRDVDEYAESISSACARLTELRAHIAIANRALARIAEHNRAEQQAGVPGTEKPS